MAIPTLIRVHPNEGPSHGGELVRLTGRDIISPFEVRFGGKLAEVIAMRPFEENILVDVKTPPHEERAVDITLQHMNEEGDAIEEEASRLPGAYRFKRPRLSEESNLIRLIRTLLQKLKAHVLANTSMTVSLDYRGTAEEQGMALLAFSEIPALALSGPVLRPSKLYTTNEIQSRAVETEQGEEVALYASSSAVDVVFTLTGVSSRTAEIFNMMHAVSTFFHRTLFIEMKSVPESPLSDLCRWEMSPEGEVQTGFRSGSSQEDSELRTFSQSFAIYGFNLGDAEVLSHTSIVKEPLIRGGPFSPL